MGRFHVPEVASFVLVVIKWCDTAPIGWCDTYRVKAAGAAISCAFQSWLQNSFFLCHAWRTESWFANNVHPQVKWENIELLAMYFEAHISQAHISHVPTSILTSTYWEALTGDVWNGDSSGLLQSGVKTHSCTASFYSPKVELLWKYSRVPLSGTRCFSCAEDNLQIRTDPVDLSCINNLDNILIKESVLQKTHIGLTLLFWSLVMDLCQEKRSTGILARILIILLCVKPIDWKQYQTHPFSCS